MKNRIHTIGACLLCSYLIVSLFACSGEHRTVSFDDGEEITEETENESGTPIESEEEKTFQPGDFTVVTTGGLPFDEYEETLLSPFALSQYHCHRESYDQAYHRTDHCKQQRQTQSLHVVMLEHSRDIGKSKTTLTRCEAVICDRSERDYRTRNDPYDKWCCKPFFRCHFCSL